MATREELTQELSDAVISCKKKMRYSLQLKKQSRLWNLQK